MLKRLFLFSILLVSCISLLAQQAKTISGVVLDASTGEILIGVSVFEPGTTNGTVTDVDGNYTIKINF